MVREMGPRLMRLAFLAGVCVIIHLYGQLWHISLLGSIIVGSLALLVRRAHGMTYATLQRRPNRDNPEGMRSPLEWKIPFQDLKIRSDDGVVVHAWLMTRPGLAESRNAPTFLCLHGNDGNVGSRLPLWAGIHRRAKVNVLALEYRGYGESDGTPSESGLVCDAAAALRFIAGHTLLNNKKVIVFGRSLGGAVAVAVASDPAYKSSIRAVILDNTFLSVSRVARRILPPLRFVPEWAIDYFLASTWRTDRRIGTIRVPTLFLASGLDSWLGSHQMQKLHQLSRACHKTLVEFPSADHSNAYYVDTDRYFGAICSFIGAVVT